MADTSSLLTRCPHCDTRFRVTGKQLGIADGKVRCGHCMEVFDAREHAVTPGGGQAGSSPRDNDRPGLLTSDPDDDLIFQDNPEEDAADGPYAGQGSGFDDEELSDSFRSVESGFGQDLSDDDDIDEVDESWAEAMLQEELPDHVPETSHSRTHESVAEPDDDVQSMENPAIADDVTGNGHPEADPPASAVKYHPVTEEPAVSIHTDDDTWTVATDPESPAAERKKTSDRSGTGSFLPLDDISPYDGLGREPVSVGSRSGSRVRGWLWSLVVLALIAVLVSQVAWFQFDRLSALPQLRPWYEKACEYAGCELAPLVAMEKIQSRKLVVRTDPDDRTALLVDAVIINQAEFEQPFPSIALTFSNLNGDVVAQSVFPPKDYLAGDGSELAAMPPGTPVRIAISIRDPGRDAVNYNLRFVNRSGDS